MAYFIPSGDYCFGRDGLCRQAVESCIDRRCLLLYGGRQSGKTTALLRMDGLLTPRGSPEDWGRPVISVYCDLMAIQFDASPVKVVEYLGERFVGKMHGLTGGEPAIEIALDDPTGGLASLVKSCRRIILNSHPDAFVIFLIDEAKRAFTGELSQGLRDNLFGVLYGGEAAEDASVGFVLAGAQDLFIFGEDDGSQIASRAGLVLLENLSRSSVAEICEAEGLDSSVRDLIFQTTGGHAGLTVFGAKQLADRKIGRDELADCLHTESRSLFRVWLGNFSVEAQAALPLLLRDRFTRRDVVQILREKEQDPFSAESVIDELVFTGVAGRDGNAYVCAVPGFVDFIRELVDSASDKTPPESWPLIEAAELKLRHVVRTVWSSVLGLDDKRLAEEVKRAVGEERFTKTVLRMEKDLKAFRQRDSTTQAAFDILDYCYLADLAGIALGREGWKAFSPVFREKRRLEDMVQAIAAVRNPLAHFRPSPRRELMRCQVACEDLIDALNQFDSLQC